jgi:hypothetical protein
MTTILARGVIKLTIHCDNCRQAVLPDDSNCWHCGAKLTPQTYPANETAEQESRQKWQLDSASSGLSLESLAAPTVVYGLITAVVILATFILLGRLGQPPLLQLATSNMPPNSWRRLADSEYKFIVTVPPTWNTVEAEESENALAAMVETLPYKDEIMLPYDAVINDLAYLLLAYKEESANDGVIVIIAESKRLSSLTLEEAEALAEANAAELGYDIVRQEIIQNANKSHFALTILTKTRRCEQQYVNGESASLIISACTSLADYVQEKGTLEEILASFEYLGRNE